MTAPYMPLFVADYLADTAHLNAAENGAYLLLIMNYWQRGKPLPADDRKLARIARMSDAEWQDARDTLAEFFREEDGEWRHSRIERELAVASEKSAKAKASARASVEARKANAERPLNERSTDAELLGEDREVSSLPTVEKISLRSCAVAKATRPNEPGKFEEFWKAYPRRDGANPKEPALKRFQAAVKAGTDPEAIISAAKSYAASERDRIGTAYIAQAVTWLNQKRWQDYQPSEQARASPSEGVHISPVADPEAWAAWKAHRGGKSLPTDPKGGWTVPTKFPPNDILAALSAKPSHLQQKDAA